MMLPLVALLLAQASQDAGRMRTAQQLMEGGRCAEAIPVLQTLVADPQSPTLRYGLGRCYFEVEDFGAAVKELREVGRAMPGSAEVHFFLGSALGLGGDIPSATEELRTAMKLDPKFEPAFRAFGMFRVQRGSHEGCARGSGHRGSPGSQGRTGALLAGKIPPGLG